MVLFFVLVFHACRWLAVSLCIHVSWNWSTKSTTERKRSWIRTWLWMRNLDTPLRLVLAWGLPDLTNTMSTAISHASTESSGELQGENLKMHFRICFNWRQNQRRSWNVFVPNLHISLETRSGHGFTHFPIRTHLPCGVSNLSSVTTWVFATRFPSAKKKKSIPVEVRNQPCNYRHLLSVHVTVKT